jgi:hypothetical protein
MDNLKVKPLKWLDSKYGDGAEGRNGRHICATVYFIDREKKYRWAVSLGSAYMNMARGLADTKDKAKSMAEDALGKEILKKFFI